jgi:hypothetical protein
VASGLSTRWRGASVGDCWRGASSLEVARGGALALAVAGGGAVLDGDERAGVGRQRGQLEPASIDIEQIWRANG